MALSDDEPFAGMKCNCCGRPGVVGVASSGYAAISFAWCAECLGSGFHPEPEWILMYLYYDVGDHGQGLVDDEYLPGTWKDGRYWSWADWRDWRRTQPDPLPDPYWDYYESSSWTGRMPADVSQVPKWLYRIAWWDIFNKGGGLATNVPKWKESTGRFVRFVLGWEDV